MKLIWEIWVNIALGGGATTGSGGGAETSNLKNCSVLSNVASHNGGGADNCNLVNCAIAKNSALYSGGGANAGSLVNCTIAANTASGNLNSGYGAAVYGAALTNCIAFGNYSGTSYPNTNYANCTLAYCCADPLSAGFGNIDVNPQILADNIHLSATSPCIGAGTVGVVSGTDIDGQQWNNPPSIGCDEWWPAPVISAPLVYQINSPAHGLTFSVIVAGQSPFTYLWSINGQSIQDDGHHSNSGTASLVVNNFGPGDAGIYQVVATNASGTATSQVAQVVIHVVDAAGANPVAPYSSWATAATNIQDAINIAAAGDIVLVTNGIYAAGGMAKAGGLTNRVALGIPMTVLSVNGYSATVIQGAWDSISTNGPGAVRCAYVADGALLIGFTLANGATLATGDFSTGGPLESGGGVWCNSTNGIISNCVLTNNSAIYGAGIISGTLNNSLVGGNWGVTYGGGTYNTTLNNCTVVNNFIATPFGNSGAGTYGGIVKNGIVVGNYDYPFLNSDNYYNGGFSTVFSYSCTSPTKSGTGNLNASPQFLDWFHLASASPCRGAGSALYASGTDLDGETWASAPSMGCDEVIGANLVGPLMVHISANQTNLLVNRHDVLLDGYTGRASSTLCSLGDGVTLTNAGVSISHLWTNSGDYVVTFTAYNNDNPAGVATNIVIHVQALFMPQLQSAVLSTDGFQFQFGGQLNANYTIQYTTNLAASSSWQTLQTIYNNNNTGLLQITDPNASNGTQFYRVLVQ